MIAAEKCTVPGCGEPRKCFDCRRGYYAGMPIDDVLPNPADEIRCARCGMTDVAAERCPFCGEHRP